MPDTTQNPTPQAVLIEQVAVPAFFEKLAAVAGINPPDQQTARQLIDLGDLVTPAVGLFLEKQARAVQSDAVSGVKFAADTAFEFLFGHRQEQQTPSAEFLKAAGVRDAALLLADQAAKAAMADSGVPMSPALTPDKKEEDEDEATAKLPKPPAA